MAIIKAQGTLLIDMVDVWVWLFRIKPELNDQEPLSIYFKFDDKTDPGILIKSPDVKAFVDSVTFWDWVHQNHSPGAMGQEPVFKAPVLVGNELMIDFEVNPELKLPSPDTYKPRGIVLMTDKFKGAQNPGYQAELLVWELERGHIFELIPMIAEHSRMTNNREPEGKEYAHKGPLGTIQLYRKLDHHLPENAFNNIPAEQVYRFIQSEVAERACLLGHDDHETEVNQHGEFRLSFAERFAPLMECTHSLFIDDLKAILEEGAPGDVVTNLPGNWKGVIV